MTKEEYEIADFRVGDVFQITPEHGRKGWIGAFVLATEIKTWGIQGFVHMITDHESMGSAFIRLNPQDIEFVGHAPMIPGEQP